MLWGKSRLGPFSSRAYCTLRHPVLQDADEAGYFYHDLVQLMGDKSVLFFPSSYRRAVKYGQRDAASEILRTEVLSRLSSQQTHSSGGSKPLYVVTYPEAVAELVISKKMLDDRSLTLHQGDTIDAGQTAETLRQLGFHEVDYVYEPGQFALRGSILDIYSFSSENPFRIDLFGDDIDSIRIFEVDTQLSKDKCQEVTIVPELTISDEKVSFLSFLPVLLLPSTSVPAFRKRSSAGHVPGTLARLEQTSVFW